MIASTAIRNRYKPPVWKPGTTSPSAFSADSMNSLSRPLEALCNPQIVIGTKWAVTLTDGNWVLEVPASIAAAGGSASMFKLKSVQDDWVTCRSWDGTTEGATDTLIAKDPNNRTTLTTQTVLTLVHSYSYSAGPSETWSAGTSTNYNKIRNNSDGSISEQEQITPPWMENEVIFAVPATTALTDGSGNPIIWLMLRNCQWEAL